MRMIHHTHTRAMTVRHVAAQPASGPHRPAMPGHYVTELDGKPLCRIPASALAPLLAEAEARGAEKALAAIREAVGNLNRLEEYGAIPLRHWIRKIDAALHVRAEQAGGNRG